jgi:hypothetical protein
MSPTDPDLTIQSWNAVEQAIDRITSSSPAQFAADTIENARDLVGACRRQSSIPNGAAKGYWSTIRIWWSSIEVEVFDDRYELYLFTAGGKTDIQHFDHAPGAEVPVNLLNQLPRDRDARL